MAVLGQQRLGGPGGLVPGGVAFQSPVQQQQVPGVPVQQVQQPFIPPTGLIGSEQALQGGLAGGLAGLQQGVGQGVGGVNTQINRGVGGLSPFIQPGQQANDRQAALSGALGQQAQQQAFQSFLDSPEQAFLQERGERAVLRNASATGGLGGGRVLQELQRQGVGLAAQDFQNQFNRLGQVTGTGLTAAGQAGQLRGQAAGLLGNIGLQGGIQASNLARGTGQDLAFGRTRAGEQIAGGIAGTTSALSNLVDQQGRGVSDLLGQGGSNLAGLLERAGQGAAGSQEELARLLSQIGLQGSGQAAGLPGIPGVQNQPGILEGVGAAAGGIGTLIAASDNRLKTNIQKVGQTSGGTDVYTWDWNAEGRRLAGGAPTIGVMAQDVPHAALIGPEGYLMVDYAKVT